MAESSTTRFLKGKTIPGAASPVKTVTVYGDKRTIHYKDGTKETVSKTVLKNKFDQVLSAQQHAAMMKTVKSIDGGKRAQVMVGGNVFGEMQKFKSIGAAKAALTRRYGKL